MKIDYYLRYAKRFNANKEVLYWINHNLSNYLKRNTPNQDEVEHILDYLVADEAPSRLKKMAYSAALSNTKKWDAANQKKGKSIKETEEDTTVVLEFEDGFKWVQLIGENAYKREGFLMRHCVASYFGKSTIIYSLRDKNNIKHATIEKNQQIKGKGNGNIHPKYIDYVVRFLEHLGMEVSDNEMKNLGYYNVTEFKEDLHPSTNLYKGEYAPINDLKDTKGRQYFNVSFMGFMPFFENEELSFSLPIKLIAHSVSYFIKKILTKTGAQIGSSGNGAQIGSSGNDAQIGSSGNDAQIGSSGNDAQIGSSGNDAQIGSSGNDA
ncbi:MAG: hypothetical protein AAF969_15395, partial [Bacteroidota bacterium]